MRITPFLAIPLALLLWGISATKAQIPIWKNDVQTILTQAQQELPHLHKVSDSLKEKVETLPPIYPFSTIKNSLLEVEKITIQGEKIKPLIHQLWTQKIPTQTINELFSAVESINHSLSKIRRQINSIPDFALNENQIAQRDEINTKIDFATKHLDDLHRLSRIFKRFVGQESRMVVLLQNQNEPRSTGGFVGSLVIVDFKKDHLSWRFEDIYALDRRIPQDTLNLAPAFFHDLSKHISLRDANFFPHFPSSGRYYQELFVKAGEAIPTTIVAINLNVVREMMKLTGPIYLPSWGITFDDQNFDTLISFLVESKIAGRFATKKPVLDFAKMLFQWENWQDLTWEQVKELDLTPFMEGKNILAYSADRPLQKLFKKWGIGGIVHHKKTSDNFAYYDFVSVGANKSEKFMWTKIWHDATIHQDGTVTNRIELIRSHALKGGELSQILQTKAWPANLRQLVTPTLLWKLGTGENRTVLRLHVPKDAHLTNQINPSGRITQSVSANNQFRILEVPMNVLPGERLKITFEYDTSISRGSHHWRPYTHQITGTPGRNQTTYLKTISTEAGGRFNAETKNIGRPLPLRDEEYRAIIDFRE